MGMGVGMGVCRGVSLGNWEQSPLKNLSIACALVLQFATQSANSKCAEQPESERERNWIREAKREEILSIRRAESYEEVLEIVDNFWILGGARATHHQVEVMLTALIQIRRLLKASRAKDDPRDERMFLSSLELRRLETQVDRSFSDTNQFVYADEIREAIFSLGFLNLSNAKVQVNRLATVFNQKFRRSRLRTGEIVMILYGMAAADASGNQSLWIRLIDRVVGRIGNGSLIDSEHYRLGLALEYAVRHPDIQYQGPGEEYPFRAVEKLSTLQFRRYVNKQEIAVRDIPNLPNVVATNWVAFYQVKRASWLDQGQTRYLGTTDLVRRLIELNNLQPVAVDNLYEPGNRPSRDGDVEKYQDILRRAGLLR